ncbi:sn-glycerol-3-phosphate ABC transporter substrate-binding protein UgpB [Cardiobacteriaceae bacterium TAE3-ERU3]|nr:sn-glycerol-3-phosphate ABC transporter substrate-binding protein UgpB [Cardiobacteriaceae bacterium TAE3-ERU3]
MRHLLALSIGLACAGSAFAVTEIEWWHAMGGETEDSLNKIVDDFNASQSDYKVKAVNKGSYPETMTAAISAFRAKQQPEIVQVYEVGTGTMMAADGAVYPVEDLMKEHGKALDHDRFLPAVISYYQTPEGKLLSMPFNSSSPVMWYNRDALKKAGIAEAPKTWGELEEAGKKLREAGYECGYSVGYPSWVLIENYSAWNNIPLSTQENGFKGTDAVLEFNNDHVKNRLQKIKDGGNFEYGGRAGDSLPLFINQKCPIWMNSSAYYGSMVGQADFDFAQAMLPYDEEVVSEPQNSIIGGASLWVLQGHTPEEYEATAAFLDFLSQPEMQARWHQETGYVPITTAAYELSKEQGFYDENPGTDTAIHQLSLNQPTPNSRGLRFGNFVQIRDIIDGEMENIWNGNKDASAAMDDAAKAANNQLRQFERANKK